MKSTTHFIGAKTNKGDMYDAITRPEMLQQWWASSAEGDVKPGATLFLTFADLTILKFRYDEMIPDRRLFLTCYDSFKSWNNTQLVFEIEQKDKQVFLTHTHQNIPNDDVESLVYFTSKWTVYLLSLKQFLETGKGTPYPYEPKLYHGD